MRVVGVGLLAPLCSWLFSAQSSHAIKLHMDGQSLTTELGTRKNGRKHKGGKASVRVGGVEIVGRDWSGTDQGDVVTFFDVRYSPGSCPDCPLPRYSIPDSSRWHEGLENPIRADGPNPKKACFQPFAPPFWAPDVEITEDCHYLDIYVPRKALQQKNAKRSVLVFIHGGSGTVGHKAELSFFGYAAEGYQGLPERQRPIVVSINYRLMMFNGFTHPSLPADQWNLWLNDSIEALKWIRKNIARFGGDKSKVTVMGESYGAMILGHLTRATRARGLFRGAIPLSGFIQGGYTVSPSDPSATSGSAAFDQALGGNTLFNVSAASYYTLDPTILIPMLSRKMTTDPIGTEALYIPEELHPAYNGLDLGRDDEKDVPLLVLNNDLEYFTGPIYVPPPPNDDINNTRAWVNSQLQTFPLYQRCLQLELEKMELENGASPTVALFRSFQGANSGNGFFVPFLSGRPNVYTATTVDNGYVLCDDNPRSVFSLAEPHHSSGLQGVVSDVPPWGPLHQMTPDEMKNTPAYPTFALGVCEPLKSEKHALDIGFVDKSVHFMVRKAIVDFVLNGTPGWQHDQHASFQPTPDSKPVLAPAMNDIVNLIQKHFNKCQTECHETPFASAGTTPTADICAPIIEGLECTC